MVNRFQEIQEQYCSSYDRRKICTYDIEFIDGPTKPLIHQTARFLYFTKGIATLYVDGNPYPIKNNSFVAILPWETTIIRDVKEPLHLIKVIYNSDFISKAMRDTYAVSKEPIKILNPIAENPVLDLTEEEGRTIRQILGTIKSEVGIESTYDTNEEKELSDTFVTNKLIELLIQFKRFITKKDCRTIEGGEIELDNRPAIFKYIYSHLADRITMDKVAEVFYLSESALGKYIYDVTGLTFSDYVAEMRINKVINLLTYTDLSLIDIAYMVGYTDASHLVKNFENRMGSSPNEYRKIYKSSKLYIFKDDERSLSYELITWIHNNYTENIRVTDAAEKFGITVVEVNRILLYQIEKNFEEFLHYLRINRACELLLTTGDPIINIALEVGYNNIKTFNRNFMRLKGIAPNDFRKTINLQHGGETIPDDIY